MRLAPFVLFTVMTLCSVFAAGAASTPPPAIERDRLPVPGMKVLPPTPTPTTLQLSFPNSSTAPMTLSTFQVSGTDVNGKPVTTIVITMPINQGAAQLEMWFSTKKVTPSAQIFVPPSTKYILKNMIVSAYTENAAGNQGNVQFTLGFTGLETIINAK
jgi:hypothetical protein